MLSCKAFAGMQRKGVEDLQAKQDIVESSDCSAH